MAMNDDVTKSGASESAPSAGPGLTKDTFSLSRRVGIGLNVTITLAAAAALVLLVNWIASILVTNWPRYFRRDVATLGSYRLSENMRNILGQIDQPVRISVLYNSQEADKARDKYQPRLIDLVGEMRVLNRNVTVEDIETEAERAAFAKRIEGLRGDSTADYRKIVAQFAQAGKSIQERLQDAQNQLGEVLNNERSWLRQFRQATQTYVGLDGAAKKLDETLAGIAQLGRGVLLTSYDKQVDKVKDFLTPAVEDLEAIQKEIANLGELANKVAGEDFTVPRETADRSRNVGQEFQHINALLAGQAPPTTGSPGADPTARAIAGVTAGLRKIAAELNAQSRLMAACTKDQPAIQGLDAWAVMTVLGPAPMQAYFASLANDLLNYAARLDTVKPETIKDNLGQLAANINSRYAENILGRFELLSRALGAVRQVDPESRKLLNPEAKFLAAVTDELKTLKEQAGKLQPLKAAASELADKLKADNVVAIQVGQEEPRVLTFDDVWPIVATPDMPMTPRKREPARTFNGDSAIYSALLSITHKPFAEVVFVHMPGAPNPMTGRPEEADIPYSMLAVLRARLEKANLKVGEWNLGQSPEPPPPVYATEEKEEDPESATTQPATQPERAPLPRVYVVLPPPAPGSPEMGERGGFGPEQSEAVADELRDGGRALFLASYSWPRMMGGAMMPYPMRMPYGWNNYLSGEWGLQAQTDYRLIQAIPDPEEGRFKLSRAGLIYMNLNTFNPNHPVGKPLEARRILLLDVCPISQTEGEKTSPGGVRYETLLSVDRGNRAIWATANTEELFDEYTETSKIAPNLDQGDLLPPLDVMVAATREPGKEGQTKPSKLILFGGGTSLIDPYVQRKVMAGSDETGVTFEPPPEVNTEIAVNAIYWLADRANYIAAGPVVVPPIRVAPAELVLIRTLVWAVLPAAVFVVGGFVWILRRRP